MVKLAASLMCANFIHLEEDINKLAIGGVDLFHIDIMDGSFVPNLSLNFDIVKQARAITKIPMDIHLMVSNPEEYIPLLKTAQCQYASFHLEAMNFPFRLIESIKRINVKAGIALNPSTEESALKYVLTEIDYILIMTVEPGFAGQKFIPGMFEKIKCVKGMIDECKRDIPIFVDGNISEKTGKECVKNGASVLVCGTSSIFLKNNSLSKNVQDFREALTSIK